ncbi:Beta-propeller repeat protein [Rosistilla ulvae]|uniref:Beta-propeller repeat protein n=1 Tax=Rosistilla ulvae TaxID=1930277 RepID=A0A517LWJ5_9BACT|nr:SBBP repeat-containing protein [Rosistilla ulvae]QDS87004.1 Beta-propeller repeat protein [Rosistilla ulvae]
MTCLPLHRLKLLLTIPIVICGTHLNRAAIGDDYEIGFSTLIGGSDWEHARDVFADESGNVYVVGGTQSVDFPTTENALRRSQDTTGRQVGSGGYCDAFVCKFSADGELIWSTLLGGPNYDRAYAVEVDDEGFVYVSGRGGPGFPVSDNAFQTQFRGTDNGVYGMQNGFIAKLSPDGSEIVWAAYVGVGSLCRDLSIDDDGNVYVALHYTGSGPLPPDSWCAGGFQPQPAGGSEIGALKIASDGRSILWGTWLGGSKDEVSNCGIRIDRQRQVYLNFTTKSTDLPTTAGAHDRSHNGKTDAFVARISSDGSQLLLGTYFGGAEDDEGNSTHNMAVDAHGNAYLLSSTRSADIPVTMGVVQPKLNGAQRDIVVAKFSPEGALQRCTYLGGSDNDGADGIYANDQGDVFLTGDTASHDFPLTSNALQTQRGKSQDAVVVVLAADFASLKFSTRLGGPNYDYGRCGFLDSRGNLYITGSVNGPGWPVHRAFQPEFAGGGGGKELCCEGGCYAGDVILAKLIRLKNE